MSWFRSNRGKVTWLALFAPACQLVLSFGHVHLGKVSTAPLLITAAASLAANTGDDLAGQPRAPPGSNTSGFGDDFCALCASINLASSLVVPSAPMVVPPISIERVITWSYAGLAPALIDHLFFDARGPPQA